MANEDYDYSIKEEIELIERQTEQIKEIRYWLEAKEDKTCLNKG